MRPAVMSIVLSVALAAGLSPRIAVPAQHSMPLQPLAVAQQEGAVAVPGSGDTPAAGASDEDFDGGAGGTPSDAQMPGAAELAPQPSAIDPDENPSAQQQPSSDDDDDNTAAAQQPPGDNGGELSGEQGAPANDGQ